MDRRRRLTSAALAVLAALVVGIAAATLGETADPSADPGVGERGSGVIPVSSGGIAREVAPAPDVLWILSAFLLGLVLLFLISAVAYPRAALKQTVAAASVGSVVLAALWLVLEFFGQSEPREGNGGARPSRESEGVVPILGGGGGGAEGAVPDPGVLGFLLVALLALGTVGVLLRTAEADDEDGGSTEAEAPLTAIGRSAGRAADRIADDDASLDNEVYRAWKEMTDHLDLDGVAARTPEEFRAAARDAGMAAADVDALTDLFRDVRYGGATPTEDREAAAAEALRRIEDRYADEEGPE